MSTVEETDLLLAIILEILTIYASHVTVFRGNAGLLLNTPLTNFKLMDACLQISYYQTTKLLQHFLLSLYSYTLSLGYREMSRTQSVRLQWDERDLYSYHNVNPLLNVGVITFCSLSPSWHDNVYRVFTNASVLQGFPDKEHAISFTLGRRQYCTPDRGWLRRCGADGSWTEKSTSSLTVWWTTPELS